MKKLFINEISDEYAQENFETIQDFAQNTPLFKGNFKFFELTFTQAETNYNIPHRLGFMPKDIIQTSLTGAGSLTWNYDSFTATNLNVTTTGACKVRAFIGAYAERAL